MTLQVVTFDLDDTLYAERDYVRSGYQAVARHLQATLADDRPFAAWLWDRFLAGESAGAFDALGRLRTGLVPLAPAANKVPRPAIWDSGEAEYAPGSGPL